MVEDVPDTDDEGALACVLAAFCEVQVEVDDVAGDVE